MLLSLYVRSDDRKVYFKPANDFRPIVNRVPFQWTLRFKIVTFGSNYNVDVNVVYKSDRVNNYVLSSLFEKLFYFSFTVTFATRILRRTSELLVI